MLFDIYRHIHRTTRRVYVGLTSRGMTRRWTDHVRSAMRGGSTLPFHRAIKCYGPDAFDHDLLETVTTLAEANEAEAWWIAHFDSTDLVIGFNLESGGNASTKHPSTIAKLKQAWAQLTPRQRQRRREMMRAGQQRLSPGARSDRIRRGNADRSPKQKAETGKKISAAQRRAHAGKSFAVRSAIAKKRMAARTPESRSASARLAGVASAKTQAIRWAAVSEEERYASTQHLRDALAKPGVLAAATAKATVTRRANMPPPPPEPTDEERQAARDAANKARAEADRIRWAGTPEVKRKAHGAMINAAATIYFDAMDPEKLAELRKNAGVKTSATWGKKTTAEIEAVTAKRAATRAANRAAGILGPRAARRTEEERVARLAARNAKHSATLAAKSAAEKSADANKGWATRRANAARRDAEVAATIPPPSLRINLLAPRLPPPSPPASPPPLGPIGGPQLALFASS